MSYVCNTFIVVFFPAAKDMKTIFFSSHDVSKPDSGSYLSEVRNLVLVLQQHSFWLSCKMSRCE